jgi:hypothetical protein
VTRAEFDDGYALIDGEVIKLDDTTLPRFRNLKTDFLILAPGASAFNNVANDKQARAVYLALFTIGKIDLTLLKPLEELQRPKWSSY